MQICCGIKIISDHSYCNLKLSSCKQTSNKQITIEITVICFQRSKENTRDNNHNIYNCRVGPKQKFWIRRDQIFISDGFRISEKVSDSVGFRICHTHIPSHCVTVLSPKQIMQLWTYNYALNLMSNRQYASCHITTRLPSKNCEKACCYTVTTYWWQHHFPWK